jgi:pyruvate kinase
LDEVEAVRTAIRTAGAGALVVALYERYQVVREAAEQALVERGDGVVVATGDRRQGG